MANDVAADKLRALFLSCCGSRTYSLRSLLAPKQADRNGIGTLLVNTELPLFTETVANGELFQVQQPSTSRGRIDQRLRGLPEEIVRALRVWLVSQ